MAKSRPKVISAAEFNQGWDKERRVHELQPLTFTLRRSRMYVPARTKTDMDEATGGPTQAVKTRTFPDEYRVWITPCRATDEDARNLRPITDTEGTAAFGFAIPLRKLGIKLPPTRQFTFTANRLQVEGGGVIYEITFQDYENLPRDVDQELLAAVKQAKALKARARRGRGRSSGSEAG